jgi:hypothetical protein
MLAQARAGADDRLDTNLLVRLVETADHPRQTAAARRAIKAHAPVFVSAQRNFGA